MKKYFLSLLFPFPLWAANSVYCPGNHQYVSVGMTQSQVIVACGAPTSKKQSQTPYKKIIPVTQLIYNSVGSAKAFYGVWSVPVGVGSGSTLTIDIVNNKVYGVRVNGDSGNASSLCGGIGLIKGDPISRVYSACGSPTTINNTYLAEDMPNASYPEVWTYSFDYQPDIRLTFVKGVLESIN